jgi:hypothetical protein
MTGRFEVTGMATSETMKRYGLCASDILAENGHEFVDLAKMGLKQPGKACLQCGIMRRRDGNNKQCGGHIAVRPREESELI